MRDVHRILVVFIALVIGVMAVPAAAQESTAAEPSVSIVIEQPQPESSAWTSKPVRISLVAAFAALQALDVVTTTKALRQGGYEASPIVRGMASRPALFISVKTVMTLWTLWQTEKMAKNGQATGAVVSLVAADALYGVIVARNFQIVNQLQ